MHDELDLTQVTSSDLGKEYEGTITWEQFLFLINKVSKRNFFSKRDFILPQLNNTINQYMIM